MKATIEDIDGMKLALEGNAVEIGATLRSFAHTPEYELTVSNDGEWWNEKEYYSSSQEEMFLVRNMATIHIENALIKIARNATMFFEEGGRLDRKTLKELLKDEEIRAMLIVLAQRYEEEA